MFPYSLQAHFPTCYGTRLTLPFSLVPLPWWLYPPLPLLPPLPPHAHPSHTHTPNTRSYPEHTRAHRNTQRNTHRYSRTHTLPTHVAQLRCRRKKILLQNVYQGEGTQFSWQEGRLHPPLQELRGRRGCGQGATHGTEVAGPFEVTCPSWLNCDPPKRSS